jgi:hypothetical protein
VQTRRAKEQRRDDDTPEDGALFHDAGDPLKTTKALRNHEEHHDFAKVFA